MKKHIFAGSLMVLIIFLGNVCSVAGDDYCCNYYSPGNPFECTTHNKSGHEGDHGNCTWWAYYKRPDIYPSCYGDAREWLSQAQAGGLLTGNFPIVGSIAVFEDIGGLGHVAYVELVNPNDSFNVTEMGYNWFNCDRSNEYSAGSATGFIYPRRSSPPQNLRID